MKSALFVLLIAVALACDGCGKDGHGSDKAVVTRAEKGHDGAHHDKPDYLTVIPPLHAAYNVQELGGAIDQLSTTRETLSLVTTHQPVDTNRHSSSSSSSGERRWTAEWNGSDDAAAVTSHKQVKRSFEAYKAKAPADKNYQWKSDDHEKIKNVAYVSEKGIEDSKAYSNKVINSQFEQIRQQQQSLTRQVKNVHSESQQDLEKPLPEVSRPISLAETTTSASTLTLKAAVRPIYTETVEPIKILKAVEPPKILKAVKRPIYTETVEPIKILNAVEPPKILNAVEPPKILNAVEPPKILKAVKRPIYTETVEPIKILKAVDPPKILKAVRRPIYTETVEPVQIETLLQQSVRQEDVASSSQVTTQVASASQALASTVAETNTKSTPVLQAPRPTYTATQRPIYTATQRPIYTATQRPIYTATQRPIYTATQRPIYTATPRPIYTSSNPTPAVVAEATTPILKAAARPIYTETVEPIKILKAVEPPKILKAVTRPIYTETVEPVQIETLLQSSVRQEDVASSSQVTTQVASASQALASTVAETNTKSTPVLQAPRPIYTATPRPIYTATSRPIYTATPRPIYTATPRPIYTATPRPIYTATPRPIYTSSNPTPAVVAETTTPILRAAIRPIYTETVQPVQTATLLQSSVRQEDNDHHRNDLNERETTVQPISVHTPMPIAVAPPTQVVTTTTTTTKTVHKSQEGKHHRKEQKKEAFPTFAYKPTLFRVSVNTNKGKVPYYQAPAGFTVSPPVKDAVQQAKDHENDFMGFGQVLTQVPAKGVGRRHKHNNDKSCSLCH